MKVQEIVKNNKELIGESVIVDGLLIRRDSNWYLTSNDQIDGELIAVDFPIIATTGAMKYVSIAHYVHGWTRPIEAVIEGTVQQAQSSASIISLSLNKAVFKEKKRECYLNLSGISLDEIELAKAEPATVSEVLHDQDRFIDRQVRLCGVLIGLGIFQRRTEHYYLVQNSDMMDDTRKAVHIRSEAFNRALTDTVSFRIGGPYYVEDIHMVGRTRKYKRPVTHPMALTDVIDVAVKTDEICVYRLKIESEM